MAITGGVRWKPDVYRSTINTTIQDFDPASDPPSGRVVMIAQAVAYDTTAFNGTDKPYKPGDPATEQKLVILYEEPIVMELAAFDAMTQAEADAAWQSALQAFLDRILPAAETLVKAIRTARVAPPIVIG